MMSNSLYEILTPDFSFSDARGTLAQLVHDGWQQVNVLFTKKGVARGGHYHQKTREAFYVVSGSVQVKLWQGEQKAEHLFQAGDFFSIVPNSAHSLEFPEDCVLIALYDQPVVRQDGSKDIIPV